MRSSKLIKILGLALVVFLVLAVIFLIKPGTQPTPSAEISDQAKSTVSLSIEREDGPIAQYDAVPIVVGESLADALVRFTEQNNIEFSYQDYGGDLGIFIDKIHGIGDDGSGRWWQYWVNDVYSQVGSSGYQPQSGDRILFKFTDEQQSL